MLDGPEDGSPEFWAAERPDAIAVRKAGRTLTYGEWNDQANRVAEALGRLGLEAGDRLGMRFRLDLPWFLLQRALQKLGVAQVAVNWKLTPGEASYILEDSGAKGLACDDGDASAWAELGVGLLVTAGQQAGAPGIRLEDLVATGQSIERFGPLRPDMVLYTSGTTGRPRGVLPVDAAAVTDFDRLLRYAAAVGNVPPYPDNPVVLLTLPTHHAAGPGIAMATCARAGTAVLVDPFDPEEVLRTIEEQRIQCWTGVPTMLLRVQALPEEVISRYDLSSLEVLTTGAAPVPQAVKEWIVERFGAGVLWETYGCSETGLVTYISPADQLRRPGSSGRAFDGVEVAIVDEDWNRLPSGAVGEIAVSSPMAFRGYIGQASLEDDLVRDGFYRTGDAGYLDQDGYLYITDRVKDMIVAGGVNIYPAEVEAAMVGHPGVESCAVIGVPHEELGEQPLAFVVPRAGQVLDAEELLSFLDGRLAPFKQPRRFEFLDSLPVNPMGKVEKTVLRKPYWEGQDRNV